MIKTPTFLLVLTVLSLLTAQTALAQDLVILSHRFDEGSFSSEIIGEIMNNNTRPYDKFDIDIYANFRDPSGALMASEQGFIDAQTLGVGQSSAFNIFLLDSELPETTTTYDLIVNDDRLVIEQPLSGESSDNDGDGVESSNNNENGNGNDNDNDQDSDQEIRTDPVLPYCDLVGYDYTRSCHDRKDYDENTLLYPCNDGTQEEDWRDCPDVSEPVESELYTCDDGRQVIGPEICEIQQNHDCESGYMPISEDECVPNPMPPVIPDEPEPIPPTDDEPVKESEEPVPPPEEPEPEEPQESEDNGDSNDEESRGAE